MNVFGASDNENGQNVPENAKNDTGNTQSVPENAQAAPERRYRATFWCEGTLEEIKALGAYMREHNIKYGKAGK